MEKFKLIILLSFCYFHASTHGFKFPFNWNLFTTVTESAIEVTTRSFNDSVVIYGPVYSSNLMEQKMAKDKKDNRKLTKLSSNDLFTSVRMFLGRIPVVKRSLGMECWQEVGCFSAMSFNDMVNGYIAMLPMGPEEIDPTFYLVTNRSKDPITFKHNFIANELLKSTFNPDLYTIIIVHGYYKGIEDWMIKITENLQKQNYENFNYIFVDWSKGSTVLNYALAASNTQVVGALIAYFVDRVCNTFKDRGLNHHRFHLIGHSLGAHTIGFAGKRLKNPKVSRITGMDPAGPGFRDKKAEHRLDYTDASQVIIIHSDIAEFVTKGLGLYEPIGDIDFYPNGGKHQPGCPESEVLENVLQSIVVSSNRDLSCSHNRAPIMLYTPDNIHNICLPVGYYCDNWETFLEGRCADCQTYNGLKRCQLLGLFPNYWQNIIINKENKNSHKFYLNTGRKNNMAFHFSNDSDYVTNQKFSLKIQAQVDETERLLIFQRKLSQSMSGSIHTLLVTFSFNITQIMSMDVQWLQSDDQILSFSNSKIRIQFIEINYMSHIRPDIRKDLSVLLCPEKNGIIRPEVQKNYYFKCDHQILPKRSALRLSSEELSPFTERSDIIATDFDNQEVVGNKMTRVLNNKWFSYFSQHTDDFEDKR